MKDFIQNLQNKPYATRVKILWGAVSIIAVVLFAVWTLSIKSSVSELPGGNILGSNEIKTFAERNEDITQIEYAETTSEELKVYFKISNPTTDILNFSEASDITLTIKGKEYHPKQVVDRQENPFVKKILSKTTNFGILVFDKIEGDEGTLVFDQLSYEKSVEDTFKDENNLIFEELKPLNKLRN